MKRILFVIFLFLLLASSCVSTKKFASYVNQKTENIQNFGSPSDNIEIRFAKPVTTENSFTRLKHLFIPAIFYWQWNTVIQCQLRTDFSIQFFKKEINKYADSLNLSDKLGKKKLIINIEQFPNAFVYTRKGRFIFVLVAYSYSDLEVILPIKSDFIADYQIVENDSVVKKKKLN